MRTTFRLESKRMSRANRGIEKSPRNSVLRVTVYAISSDVSHERCDRIGPRLARIMRALIPHHHRKQDTNAALVKIGNHLTHARYSTWHGANHVVLVAIVDTHIRIRRPNQNSVNAPIPLFQIVQVPIHRVAICTGIIKVTIFDHHLRLNKTRLRPLQFRKLVARPFIADPNAPLVAPVPYVRQPIFMLGIGTGRRSTLPGTFHAQARGTWDLLSDWGELRVLSICNATTSKQKNNKACHAGFHVSLLDRNWSPKILVAGRIKGFKYGCPVKSTSYKTTCI